MRANLYLSGVTGVNAFARQTDFPSEKPSRCEKSQIQCEESHYNDDEPPPRCTILR
jgi:hypothetical protein